MHPTGHGLVLSLAAIVLVQVTAIVDFHIGDDPKLDAQVCCMQQHTFPQEPYRICHEKHANAKLDNDTVMCIHKCYYEAIGMFSADGQIQSNNYIKYRDGLAASLQDVFSYSLALCAKIVDRLFRQSAAVFSKMRCNPVPYMFNRCLMEVGITNCPTDRWMNSTLCDRLVVRMKEKYGPGVVYDPAAQNGNKGKDSG